MTRPYKTAVHQGPDGGMFGEVHPADGGDALPRASFHGDVEALRDPNFWRAVQEMVHRAAELLREKKPKRRRVKR